MISEALPLTSSMSFSKIRSPSSFRKQDDTVSHDFKYFDRFKVALCL